MGFEKATVQGSYLRFGLCGPAGSGKTMTGLQILKEFGCKKIACIDSERGRARKYADLFTFDVDDKSIDYDPKKYIEKINEAAKLGYDGLLLDSLTHVWSGTGGFLDKVEKMGGSSFSNGWKAMKPVQAQLVHAITTYPGHVVATMRVKTEYVVEVNEQGKAVPRKVGLKPVQADDMEYEFDYTLMLGSGGTVNVFKQAGCPDIEGLQTTREDLPKIYNSIKRFLGVK